MTARAGRRFYRCVSNILPHFRRSSELHFFDLFRSRADPVKKM
jgi:hypothetical protein